MAKSKASLSKSPVKDWGFFIYIAGDNNLSDAGLEDISELEEVGSSPAVHVGVEIDTYGEHTGSIRYEITEPDWTGAAHRTVISRLGEKDTGDPRTLTNFANWALKRYPSRKRLMVIWNHGSGFRAPRRDIAFDDFGSALDMPEVELALNRAGVGTGRRHGKVTVLGFDACLMCMVEIAHHFRDVADYIVGSEQTEPGDGWPYHDVLRLLRGSPVPTAAAKGVVSAYINDYRSRGVGDVTQSAIDTAKTPAAITALHGLGAALRGALAAERATITSVRTSVQAFEYADYVDALHLARRLRARCASPAVRAAAAALDATAAASVLLSRTNGATVANAYGLSVWFPPTRDVYFAHRAKYLRLNCNAGAVTGWVAFLDDYFA